MNTRKGYSSGNKRRGTGPNKVRMHGTPKALPPETQFVILSTQLASALKYGEFVGIYQQKMAEFLDRHPEFEGESL